MTYTAHKIIDHLFQGGYPPPGDVLKKAGVDVLVLCAKEHQDAGLYEGLTVILAPGDDDNRPHRLSRFIDRWKEVGLQVADHVKLGRNVVVTCMAGQNRSGLVTAIALRHLTGWNGTQIVSHIKAHRPQALNNMCFVHYIVSSYK